MVGSGEEKVLRSARLEWQRGWQREIDESEKTQSEAKKRAGPRDDS